MSSSIAARSRLRRVAVAAASSGRAAHDVAAAQGDPGALEPVLLVLAARIDHDLGRRAVVPAEEPHAGVFERSHQR